MQVIFTAASASGTGGDHYLMRQGAAAQHCAERHRAGQAEKLDRQPPSGPIDMPRESVRLGQLVAGGLPGQS